MGYHSSMQIEDLLLTLAGISITFAGLIGIMVAFTARDGKLSPSDSLRVRVIIITSIYSAFFSLLPISMLSIEYTVAYAWSISTALHLLFMVCFLASQRIHELRAGKTVIQEMQGRHRDVAWLISPIVLALHIANLSTLLGPAQPGLYGLAILLITLTTGIVFIGLIFQRLL